MPRNVEIKARAQDLASIERKAKELSGSEGVEIKQEDTFFKVEEGRLKLRNLQNSPSQLIFYNRPDQEGPKLSDYHIATTSDPDSLKCVLGKALGIKGEVKKSRQLYLVGQTRVHCDRVENLGNFVELEVVLEDSQTVEEGQKIADDLMSKLGILPEDLITGAYMDLILKSN